MGYPAAPGLPGLAQPSGCTTTTTTTTAPPVYPDPSPIHWDSECNGRPLVPGINPVEFVSRVGDVWYWMHDYGFTGNQTIQTVTITRNFDGTWNVVVTIQSNANPSCYNNYAASSLPAGTFTTTGPLSIQGSTTALIQTNGATCGGCDPANATAGIWVP